MADIKRLPLEITHLDVIKTIAVIIMIVDHIGLYFFSDNEWFRAIGRIGMPVWFFMVGYASARDLSGKLLICALVLVIADFLLFQKILALSALVTIICLRLIIDPFMNFVTRSRYIFGLAAIILTLFAIPSAMVMEYGTSALLFAMAGFMVRNKDVVMSQTFFTNKDYIGFLIYIFVAFCVVQNAVFGFSDLQLAIMGVFTGFTIYILSTMRPMTFPNFKEPIAKIILQYCGRNTLDIYVVHLIAFKVILFARLALN